MSDRLKALREQRGVIVTEMRGITERAATEKRDLTSEELAKHSELFDQQEAKRAQIEAEERSVNVAREEAQRDLQRDDERRERERNGDHEGAADAEKREARAKAFRNFLAGGARALSPDEARALQVTPDTAGGYLLAPAEFVTELIKAVDNQLWIRGAATVFPVNNANGLGAASLDNDPADSDWTTELATGSEDSSMSFGKRELKPNPVAKRIKISKQLLRTASIAVDALVQARLAYKFGVTLEKAYMTGSGNSQPLGLFTASNDGISTGRDVSTGNTSTAIGADGLIEAKYSLKGQYWNSAKWLFHRDAIKSIAKLKDGDGQYLWSFSLREGQPDTVLGRPVMMSEYAPNTFTTGLYVGMIGDFSKYWIADLLDLQIQVLNELYAETNQVGYIGRYEGDGMPVLEEAFARVKLA